ncbi:hypothetical protein [Luteimonas panaciterrae]|uniref:hypothetical protein n=1 Tax=Luteimonas panaciterrae TaxID=363885 RepID=UPI001CFA6B4E|nr:hypothetical protein [Luteimonas panaciterrae]
MSNSSLVLDPAHGTMICYLCGKQINGLRSSGDHIIPSTLIGRTQPKVRGFDYAGTLPTHEECNNRFGPETYVARAIELLEFLDKGEGASIFQNRYHPEIKIQILDADRLTNFTKRDLIFFKFIDLRDLSDKAWSKPDFFKGKQKTNPTRDAMLVALSVLAKSAAALLIKRKLRSVPQHWHIYAIPYGGSGGEQGFDELLGEAVPFGISVKAWVHQLDDGPDWLVLYRAKHMLVYLIFVFQQGDTGAVLKRQFPDAQIHEFTGSAVNDLLVAGWRLI